MVSDPERGKPMRRMGFLLLLALLLVVALAAAAAWLVLAAQDRAISKRTTQRRLFRDILGMVRARNYSSERTSYHGPLVERRAIVHGQTGGTEKANQTTIRSLLSE